MYGNSQNEAGVYVWDIASSSICKRLGENTGFVRDLFSSRFSDTLAIVSFDKKAIIYLRDM
jgi:hypothetical protein